MYNLRGNVPVNQFIYNESVISEYYDFFGDFQTSSITSASSLDEDEAQTVIGHLQEELIALRLRDADTESMVKDLRTKIRELEEVQRLTPHTWREL